MPKYYVDREVDAVHGHQTFVVDADSEDEAKRKFKEKGGEYYSEELEVYALEAPDFSSLRLEP